MGSLVKETPYSEITATLEVLERQGITREHFKKIRADSVFAKRLSGVACGTWPGSMPVHDDYAFNLWRKFYKEIFDIDEDLYEALKRAIPESQFDFSWMVIMHKRITSFTQIFRAFDYLGVKYADHFLGFEINELDGLFANERDPKNGSYLIRVRNRQEADVELKDLSADNLKTKCIKSITVLERLMLELIFFWTTGGHLDTGSRLTLCSGSRFLPGGYKIPAVRWFNQGHDDPNQHLSYGTCSFVSTGWSSRQVLSWR
ncbi:MAG: hypothetical protein PHN74_00515 [Candidatus Pacebacteria bacterium]|nr:hypothetical protein [Candidatus Paceibacterota bacterium]